MHHVHELQALGRILPFPHPTQPAFDSMVITFEDDEAGRRWVDARTRLGRDSRDVILLHQLAGGLFLDADCRRRVDLDVPRLNDRLVRRLALRAVRVDQPDLIRQLDELETPQSISKHPLLTRHKLLVLEDGQAEIGRLIVVYESLLGLEIRTQGDGSVFRVFPRCAGVDRTGSTMPTACGSFPPVYGGGPEKIDLMV